MFRQIKEILFPRFFIILRFFLGGREHDCREGVSFVPASQSVIPNQLHFSLFPPFLSSRWFNIMMTSCTSRYLYLYSLTKSCHDLVVCYPKNASGVDFKNCETYFLYTYVTVSVIREQWKMSLSQRRETQPFLPPSVRREVKGLLCLWHLLTLSYLEDF